MYQGFSLIAGGLVFIAAFAYVNLVLQPKWFPQETTGGAGPGGQSPLPHFVVGLLVFGLLAVGTMLIVAGVTEIGILRSRG